jgi:sugar phosphate permease
MATSNASDTERGPQPTWVRYEVAAASVLMAFMLYLDRVCLGEIVKSESFRADFAFPKEEIGGVLGAFFFTYALAQIPAGWASDRWGARRMLTLYIVGWSLMTALTGWVSSLTGLLLARLLCGVAQAGAYPTSGGVIRRWFPLHRRGMASSWVSLGGRMGGMLAPAISTTLMIGFGGWRAVLILYGAIGLGVAWYYWRTVRDAPELHARVNAEERHEIGHPPDAYASDQISLVRLLVACGSSSSLWLSSTVQFSINVGWVFLITWLPSYLKDVKHVGEAEGSLMLTMVLACGLPGMLLGGWASDRSVKRFGLRIGRVLPLVSASSVAGLAYLVCPWLDSVWMILACCGMVSMMTDFGNPSFWAFMQDVGGRYTATIYGWANMWGNLGASLSAIMIPQLMRWGESGGHGHSLVFFVCSGFFFFAALCALGINATRPIGKSNA